MRVKVTAHVDNVAKCIIIRNHRCFVGPRNSQLLLLRIYQQQLTQWVHHLLTQPNWNDKNISNALRLAEFELPTKEDSCCIPHQQVITSVSVFFTVSVIMKVMYVLSSSKGVCDIFVLQYSQYFTIRLSEIAMAIAISLFVSDLDCCQ